MKYNFDDNLLVYDSQLEYWYVDELDFNTLSSAKKLIRFFKIFEYEPIIFLNLLKNKIREYNLDDSIVSKLPLQQAIELAIENKMFYWINQSNKWLDHIYLNLSFFDKLSNLVNDKSYPQNIRHFWKKILDRRRHTL